MAKKYFWLKLKEDFFKSKEMKKLRRVAGGDTFSIIYLKMILSSIQTEGKLFFESVEDTFAEELAYEIDEDKENVELTLGFLTKHKLIEYGDHEDEFILDYAINNIGSESDSAERVRLFRERKALQCNEKLLQVTKCNTSVTKCNTEREKEKEKEKEKKKKEKNIDQKSSVDDQLEIDLFFDSIWIKYPKKQGKSSISKTQKNKLYKVGDELFRCIERYISEPDLKINGGWKELQQGSSFFNKTYLEYMDKEYKNGGNDNDRYSTDIF